MMKLQSIRLARIELVVIRAACAVTLWSACVESHAHPEIPGDRQDHPLVLVGADIHTMTRETIRGGSLLIVDGKIAAIGQSIEVPDDAERIDVTGMHLYPGLFNTDGTLGLVEINSVRATLDTTETGDINPNVRADIAINPDSELIPVTRSGGVLLNLSAPMGGIVSGQSSVFQLDGWTREDMTLLSTAAMHVTWPTMQSNANWWDDAAVRRQREARDNKLTRLTRAFEDAQAYRVARENSDVHAEDLRWEALLPVLRGEIPLVVDADAADEIQAAVAFAANRQLRLIIRGGYDAPHCAALLRERQVPVIVTGTYRLPLRRHDPYDAAYTLPERLRQAKVLYCIAGSARFDAANIRNLPYHAAMAVAFGLPHDEGLKSITIYPARILGLDERVGSLDVGKDATLIVTDGDPLESGTNVQLAYVQGRLVSLQDRQKRLWSKYQEKQRRQQRDSQVE